MGLLWKLSIEVTEHVKTVSMRSQQHKLRKPMIYYTCNVVEDKVWYIILLQIYPPPHFFEDAKITQSYIFPQVKPKL